MAQIRVVEKKGGLAWLWVLIALILVAALIWYVLSYRNSQASGGEVTPAGVTAPPPTRDSAVMPRSLEAMPVAGPWSARRARVMLLSRSA